MSFHVGQKVVVVGTPPDCPRPPDNLRATGLVMGGIYTIRDIDLRTIKYHGTSTIRVSEVSNRKIMTVSEGEWELGYNPNGFRPLIERKTDISVFTEMLNTQIVPLKQREKA